MLIELRARLRRSREHRAREQTSRGASACRLRRRRLQDALQDSPRRSPRERAATLRAYRNGQLPSADGARLHGLWPAVRQRGPGEDVHQVFMQLTSLMRTSTLELVVAIAVQSARPPARVDQAATRWPPPAKPGTSSRSSTPWLSPRSFVPCTRHRARGFSSI